MEKKAKSIKPVKKNTNNIKDDYADLLQIDLRESYEKKPAKIKKLTNNIADIIKNAADYIAENKILPLPALLMIFTGILSAVIWRVSIASHTAADFFTDTVSFALRFVLTGLTYNIPFSFAEFLLYVSIPFALYLAVNFVFKTIFANRRTRLAVFLKGVFKLTAFAGVLLFIFTFAFGVCYGRTPINQLINKNPDINFERRLISSEDLAESMEILIGEANTAAEKIKYIYAETGSTKMPYNLKELNKRLNESYKNLLKRHDFLKKIQCRVKPVIMSVEMSKMHISGIYFPFTGEANISIDSPDYNLPYVSAHEMAHLMGVAREDEANFTAFLVCLYSDDNYIRYSGLVNMIEYISGAMRKADSEKYFELTAEISHVVRNEIAANSAFFDKYRDTQISKVASAVNNTYLRAQGQEEGVQSYGLVVDLAVAYLVDVYNANQD